MERCDFLPVSAEEMHERGWWWYDALVVSGDAYVDHPSFGTAVISRVLEAEGLRVAVLAQPDWHDAEAFRAMGRPRLGVFIGAVPGTGAAISSFLAYNEAKRTSKHPEEYGHGSEEAVVASESANNAVTGATLIPLLTLGIPGDTNTAVLLGALTMQGIAAGPQLFTQHGEWVYTIMLGLIAVNIFMYLQGRVFIRGFVNITRVPTSTLVPILVMLCVIGAYAIDYSVFNAIFMVGVGIFGYFMTKLDMPMTPMVIGLVLGKLCESNLRRALIVSKGSWATFFTSPISLFFILLSLFMLFFPYIKKKLAARRAAA